MMNISGIIATNIPHADLPRPGVPRLSVFASLGALFGLMGDAYRMAYVDPFAGLRRQTQILPEDDPDGRDPAW